MRALLHVCVSADALDCYLHAGASTTADGHRDKLRVINEGLSHPGASPEFVLLLKAKG